MLTSLNIKVKEEKSYFSIFLIVFFIINNAYTKKRTYKNIKIPKKAIFYRFFLK